MEDYKDFILKKELLFEPVGFEPMEQINPMLFPFQKDIVIWALRKGRACLFEDCGLGKTPQQLEWSKHVSNYTNKPVLILAPLSVSIQTKEEGLKFNIPVNICQSQSDVINGVNITNYDKLHKFDGSLFSGVVLDESSILKNMSGFTRNQIITMFRNTPYRLACSATPAPNDYMELGNHSEFLGVMDYSVMLSMFFVNAGNVEDVQWRLKKHAGEKKFWQWLSSWAIMMSNPSDLLYEQSGFDLPPLNYIEHKIKSNTPNFGFFCLEAKTMEERRNVRRETIQIRCEKAAEIINDSNEQWLIWCNLNEESALLTKLINNAEEVTGSTSPELREKRMLGFSKGIVKRLVTKPSIAGFGMNWQQCNKMAFVGLSDSWEQLYQAIRRIWRFGQTKEVEAHIIIEEREGAVLNNIKRKDKQAKHMIQSMINHTKDFTNQQIHQNTKKEKNINTKMQLPSWI